jgi:nucleotide-binding universal stress UspA family protein
MGKMLIAYDGSEPSRHACRTAAQMAAAFGHSATVLVIGELVESGYGSLVPVAEVEVFHKVCAEGAALVREAGVAAVDERVEWGSAGTRITEIAAEGGYELIVVGHQGAGLQEFLLGSVAKHVIDHAECSVLVVR